MKCRLPHSVPLSPAAIDVLAEVQREGAVHSSGLIFPVEQGQPLSDLTFNTIVRDIAYGDNAIPHGFRATSKTCNAEFAQVRDKVSDAALAPKISEKYCAIYLRIQFLQERWPLATDQIEFSPANGFSSAMQYSMLT